ncbi:hypothetical protein [Paenibacillus elgii]|uniref:hypothetical protein n=1 Tax=Paenibacillus elgii TaxID=189691 RepID=UPI000248E0EF|nr:hypothetical protein [Paenibacillus elgii]
MIRIMRPRTVKQRFRLWIALAILMLGLSINIAFYIYCISRKLRQRRCAICRTS